MFFRQFTIIVRNIEKSIEFYESITGLKISRRFQEGNGEIAFLANQSGETEIELVQMPGMQQFEGKGFFICFITDHLNEMHEQATAKRLNPSSIRTPDARSRYFYVYDPDGVSVQLKQIVADGSEPQP